MDSPPSTTGVAGSAPRSQPDALPRPASSRSFEQPDGQNPAGSSPPDLPDPTSPLLPSENPLSPMSAEERQDDIQSALLQRHRQALLIAHQRREAPHQIHLLPLQQHQPRQLLRRLSVPRPLRRFPRAPACGVGNGCVVISPL